VTGVPRVTQDAELHLAFARIAKLI
jgi:hypothetical protein